MQVVQDMRDQSFRDEEFDLRPYVDTLLRRRRLIAAVTLLVMVFGLLTVLVSPPVYQAKATVAIIKAKTDVAFGSSLNTVSDEDLAAAGAAQVLDVNARRSAFAGLVKNAAIASNVIVELGDQLPLNQRNPSILLNQVGATIVNKGDLIDITVSDSDPERAAAIANAWAVEYETLVNTLYSGAPTTLSDEVGTELARAREEYHAAQAAVEAFILENQLDELTRLIDEKKLMLDQLQQGRSTAVSTIIDEQVRAQQQIISAYYNAQSASKLLLFNKQQEAKRTMFSAYIDAEIQNRLAAFTRDRNIRMEAFNTYVDAELNGKMAVIDEQINEKTSTLSRYYAEKTTTAKLLDNARTMRDQIDQGGNAAAASNTLALLLLKSQAFTPGEELSSNLQLQVGDTVPASAEEQIRDVDAIIGVLEQRETDLDERITSLSEELLAGTGYNFLDEISVTPLSRSTTPGTTRNTAESLSANLAERYRELFEVGPMALEGQEPATDTQLFEEIKTLYPDLFTVDQYMALTEALPQDTQLSQAADERARELLNLQGLEGLPTFAAASGTLVQATDQIQDEIRRLSVEQERASVKQGELTQTRDLAVEVYNTLRRKQTEIGVATAIVGSEVRVAGPAVPPLGRSSPRQPTLMISALVGVILGVLVAFVFQLLYGDGAPHLVIGRPSAIWNRVLRWVVTPVSGLATQPRSSGDAIPG